VDKGNTSRGSTEKGVAHKEINLLAQRLERSASVYEKLKEMRKC
jgi:hypothetical protein